MVRRIDRNDDNGAFQDATRGRVDRDRCVWAPSGLGQSQARHLRVPQVLAAAKIHRAR
jgi:hypothetical protein